MTFVVGVVVGILLAAIAAWVLHRRWAIGIGSLVEDLDSHPGERAVSDPADLRTRVNRLVTSARDQERNVQERRRRYEAALDLVAEGIVVCDAQGETVFMNAAAGLLIDARHEETLILAALERCLGDAVAGRASEDQVDLYGPPARTVMLAASPVRHHDRIVGIVAVLRDESRLRQLQDARRQFVANVSHELKTPVGALALLAEAVSDVEDRDARQRLIDRLADEAHRLGRVIDDLLELSEVDEADPPRCELGLSELVVTACDRLTPLADEHGVEVRVTATGEVDVLGNRRQLDSAISNLVENAIKYADGHSPVAVTVSEADDWVDVVVADRGIGIPRAEQDRIFERFHRADRARRRSTGGTGLGLSIVRNVARNHGGEVSVRSREGEGSTFTLRLPLAVAAAEPRSVE